jgi:hypothetical protein
MLQAGLARRRVRLRGLGHRTLFEGPGLNKAMAVFTRDWEALTPDELAEVRFATQPTAADNRIAPDRLEICLVHLPLLGWMTGWMSEPQRCVPRRSWSSTSTRGNLRTNRCGP